MSLKSQHLIPYSADYSSLDVVILSTVTPVNAWIWCLALGVLVTSYTCLGGLRGVIWTDVFQATIMILGLIAVFVQVNLMLPRYKYSYLFSIQTTFLRRICT